MKDLELGDKNKENFTLVILDIKIKMVSFLYLEEKDRFIKILGHRINLDELENIINEKFPKAFVD